MEVEVDRAIGSIKYSVKGTLKAKHTNSILEDSSRVFFPFVEMWSANDAVEWFIY